MRQVPLIFILYDSITNSVFDGQVLQPLLRYKKTEQHVYLVSYETNKVDQTILDRIAVLLGTKPVIFHRKRFMPSAQSLKQFLHQFASYKIIARGPLAGYLALQATDTKNCATLIIQARGLLAEEHRYIHTPEKNIFLKLLYKLRTRQLARLEQWVYYHATRKAHCYVQTVSHALKEYLVTHYNANKNCIAIAQDDIPSLIPATQIRQWKATIRNRLSIKPDAQVYCYNGSAKPWQCPELVINYFQEQDKQQPNCFLLILTQDVQQFEQHCKQAQLSQESYLIISVPHEKIYKYLAAADIGLLFRKPHIINWVSRPTKLLEYRAVGLSIAHNDTVAYVQSD